MNDTLTIQGQINFFFFFDGYKTKLIDAIVNLERKKTTNQF